MYIVVRAIMPDFFKSFTTVDLYNGNYDRKIGWPLSGVDYRGSFYFVVVVFVGCEDYIVCDTGIFCPLVGVTLPGWESR